MKNKDKTVIAKELSSDIKGLIKDLSVFNSKLKAKIKKQK
jgi:hypothetical protein